MAYHQAAPQTYGKPPLDWPHYGIGFGPAIARYFAKYAAFRGRASRGEYWWVGLLNVLVVIVYSVLLQASGGIAPGAVGATPAANLVLNVTRLYFLGVLVPNVSVQVRRLHDTGRSGWWSLFNLVPLVGQIVLAVLCLADTSPRAERFGPPVESQPPQDGWGQGYQTGPYPASPADAQGYGPPVQPYQPGPYGTPGAGTPPQGYGAPPAYGAAPTYGTPPAYDPPQQGYSTPPAHGGSTAYGPPPTSAPPAPSAREPDDDAQPAPEGGPPPS